MQTSPVPRKNRKVPNSGDDEDEDDSLKDFAKNPEDLDSIDEMEGVLDKNSDEYNQFMNTVMEGDDSMLDDGAMVKDMTNQNLSSFAPNMMFEQLVKNFKNAKNIYGESMLRHITGDSADAIQRNIKFPEYQKQIQMKIRKRTMELRQRGLLNKENEITDKGYRMASLALYAQDLDNIMPKGMMGNHVHKKKSHYGGREEVKAFRKGDRFRDIAIRRSLRTAIRRGHKKLEVGDLRAFENESRGEQNIVYAIDSSGSMKGAKVDVCKKAGLALAYNAIQNKDKVGLVVFGEDVKKAIPPTNNFSQLLHAITKVRAAKETNMSDALEKAIELFPAQDNVTKHLLVLTDGMPTAGEDPQKETLEAVSKARAHGITISMVGINLDEDGAEFARKITEVGDGKFYVVNDVEEINQIVLTDYYTM